ncbi:MAG: hypothetical protein VB102_12215 [Paludibacter sp.]|nr:hypothetical protein [Paludibacter sp.]
MKVSLNQGAVEQKDINGKKENVSIYIGNYLHEYNSIGRKEIGFENWKKLKAGEILEIPKGSTLFEKFVLNKSGELDSSKKSVHYKRMKSFITSKWKKYINKTDYDKIGAILKDFVLSDIDYSTRGENATKKSILRENNKDLSNYINDFALMAVYVRKMCFENLTHYQELKNAIDEKQKIKIRNFYAQLQNSTGVDIEKIIIKYDDTENLEISSPTLIKMILYEFAEKYYTLVERLDKGNWENEIGHFEEVIKSGRPKELNTPYFKAVENVFLDFVDEYIFTSSVSGRKKYTLLGRLLKTVGLVGYDDLNPEQEGYIDEGDYYYKLFTKRSN